MIKYGLISKVDIEAIEKVLDLILSGFPEGYISVTEVGCYGGDTGYGISQYLFSKGRLPVIIGIDNLKDNEAIRFKYNKVINGNSSEVYNQIEDESQHLIFIDGCHCFAHVISDFFCYSSKVKSGGYLIFHDTGKHIKPFKDFQHGDKENPDAYISVRKALQKIGLLNNRISGWRLMYDKADEDNEAGGVCAFKKFKLWD